MEPSVPPVYGPKVQLMPLPSCWCSFFSLAQTALLMNGFPDRVGQGIDKIKMQFHDQYSTLPPVRVLKKACSNMPPSLVFHSASSSVNLHGGGRSTLRAKEKAMLLMVNSLADGLLGNGGPQ